MGMTNEQKLKQMGFADYSFIRSPIRILVSDSATGVHGKNVVKTIQMCGNYCGVPLEIYLHGDRTTSFEKADELGIKIISQSLGFEWSDSYKLKAQRFIDNGGIIINSAGNEGNEQTTVPKDYAVIVGCVFDTDNGGSDVVSHSGWTLPSDVEGIDNIFTHTSSATPCVAFGVAIIKELTGYNFQEMKDFIKSKAIKDSRLEEGEVLFQMPEIKKTVVKMEIGGKAYVNGVEKALDVPAQILNGRTLVPFRFIGESLGCDVSYTTDLNNKVKDVTLTKYGV